MSHTRRSRETANVPRTQTHSRRFPMLKALALSCAFSPALHAQTPDPPQAPLPSVVTSARTLFLGNAGDQENADCLRAYNDFYASLAALPRFQLVADPAAADLILELHYEIGLGQAVASHDSNSSVRQFRVVLLDPHTHVALWSLTERTNYATFKNNRNKNLDETVTKLAADFSSLTSSQPPGNDSCVKHPHFP